MIFSRKIKRKIRKQKNKDKSRARRKVACELTSRTPACPLIHTRAHKGIVRAPASTPLCGHIEQVACDRCLCTALYVSQHDNAYMWYCASTDEHVSALPRMAVCHKDTPCNIPNTRWGIRVCDNRNRYEFNIKYIYIAKTKSFTTKI